MNKSAEELEKLKKKLDEKKDMPQQEKDHIFNSSKVTYDIRDALEAAEMPYPEMLKVLCGVISGLILSCETPMLAIAAMFEDMSGYIYACEHVAKQKLEEAKNADKS